MTKSLPGRWNEGRWGEGRMLLFFCKIASNVKAYFVSYSVLYDMVYMVANKQYFFSELYESSFPKNNLFFDTFIFCGDYYKGLIKLKHCNFCLIL
jgi:hypothetical protein